MNKQAFMTGYMEKEASFVKTFPSGHPLELAQTLRAVTNSVRKTSPTSHMLLKDQLRSQIQAFRKNPLMYETKRVLGQAGSDVAELPKKLQAVPDAMENVVARFLRFKDQITGAI